jgi:hypothetical protein
MVSFRNLAFRVPKLAPHEVLEAGTRRAITNEPTGSCGTEYRIPGSWAPLPLVLYKEKPEMLPGSERDARGLIFFWGEAFRHTRPSCGCETCTQTKSKSINKQTVKGEMKADGASWDRPESSEPLRCRFWSTPCKIPQVHTASLPRFAKAVIKF